MPVLSQDMKISVAAFVKRAKDQGIRVMVLQVTPIRRLYFTGPDSEMPTVLGETIGWAVLLLAKASKTDPETVLQALMTAAGATARRVIRQATEEPDLKAEELRAFVAQVKPWKS